MATLTEDHVRVSVTLTRDIPAGADHVAIKATSYDAEDKPIRQFNVLDLYPTLPGPRQTQVSGILDDVVTYVKAQLGIS